MVNGKILLLIFIIFSLFAKSSNVTIKYFKSDRQNEYKVKPNEGNTYSESNVTDSNNLFWLLPETNTLMNELISENSASEMNENDKNEYLIQTEGLFELPESTTSTINSSTKDDQYAFEDNNNLIETPNSNMDETLLLSRSNCNLEIFINDNDLRLQIKFEPLKKDIEGNCCIVLKGNKNLMLALVISDIHFQNDINSTLKETLRIVKSNYGFDFILKEYMDNENLPVLLTESHKVFLNFSYNSMNALPRETYSHFNLEVFSYTKMRTSYMD